jgi:hypothetical protein
LPISQWIAIGGCWTQDTSAKSMDTAKRIGVLKIECFFMITTRDKLFAVQRYYFFFDYAIIG